MGKTFIVLKENRYKLSHFCEIPIEMQYNLCKVARKAVATVMKT